MMKIVIRLKEINFKIQLVEEIMYVGERFQLE